jgi:hypothetical protein
MRQIHPDFFLFSYPKKKNQDRYLEYGYLEYGYLEYGYLEDIE